MNQKVMLEAFHQRTEHKLERGQNNRRLELDNLCFPTFFKNAVCLPVLPLDLSGADIELSCTGRICKSILTGAGKRDIC